MITGPSNAGKTRLTARALDAWVAERGAEGVVVLEFAPEVERDGVLLGGRLDRFVEIPDPAFRGVLDAHAPRAAASDEIEAGEFAADNAERARSILDAAPDAPTAVFVNDATIPFQHEAGDPDRLISYCEEAEAAVLNAFESEELGVDDPVSRCERAALDRLRECVDRTVALADDGDG